MDRLTFGSPTKMLSRRHPVLSTITFAGSSKSHLERSTLQDTFEIQPRRELEASTDTDRLKILADVAGERLPKESALHPKRKWLQAFHKEPAEKAAPVNGQQSLNDTKLIEKNPPERVKAILQMLQASGQESVKSVFQVSNAEIKHIQERFSLNEGGKLIRNPITKNLSTLKKPQLTVEQKKRSEEYAQKKAQLRQCWEEGNLSYQQMSKKLGIPYQTVITWKTQFEKGQTQQTENSQAKNQKFLAGKKSFSRHEARGARKAPEDHLKQKAEFFKLLDAERPEEKPMSLKKMSKQLGINSSTASTWKREYEGKCRSEAKKSSKKAPNKALPKASTYTPEHQIMVLKKLAQLKKEPLTRSQIFKRLEKKFGTPPSTIRSWDDRLKLVKKDGQYRLVKKFFTTAETFTIPKSETRKTGKFLSVNNSNEIKPGERHSEQTKLSQELWSLMK